MMDAALIWRDHILCLAEEVSLVISIHRRIDLDALHTTHPVHDVPGGHDMITR